MTNHRDINGIDKDSKSWEPSQEVRYFCPPKTEPIFRKKMPQTTMPTIKNAPRHTKKRGLYHIAWHSPRQIIRV